MQHTTRQTAARTLADLYRSIDRQHAITITCLKEDKDQDGKTIKVTDPTTGKKTPKLVETVRTIEIYDLVTTADGDILIKAMDRQTHEPRHFRLSRLLTYTLHRSAFQVERPAEDTSTAEQPAFLTADDVIAWELSRDPDDADYQPRPLITALAA